MIARFFIDRPIFAAVLSIVITLIGGIACFALPIAQYPRITPPGVSVSISYPGASAAVVADTVAAPIEQQVNGVEGMLYMSSQMGNDGTYTLTVTFDIGTDLNTDLVMVQNRVTLAMPQLPTAVQNQGITIRKKTPDILMIVNFFSPDGRYDDIYLSNFATIYVRDELLRVYGVSDINYLGQRDYSIRAWLDPQKLASRNMTAIDVAQAISQQNLVAPAGRIGQPPAPLGQSSQLPIDTLGRLTEPEQFGDIIVKVDPATASNTSGLSADSVSEGSTQAGQPGVGSSSSSGSGGGAGSAAGGGQMQIDTIGGASTVDATAGSISPPTIGPTIRLGAVGGSGGTTGTATSTASITITDPTTVILNPSLPGMGSFTGRGAPGGGALA
ncbi:MAG: efflux RND transporter permease subunit, partial [Isosphaeraceae bacterium]